MRHHIPFSRGLLVASCWLAILTFVSVAFGEGRLHWAKKTLKERDDHSWHLRMAIYLPRPPDVAEMPAKFEFEPIAYFERALVDGNKIIEHRVPLRSQQSIIADEDIGFLDPGSGKIQKRTRFSFKITRDHGFAAGEYKVTVRDGRNGRVIGRPIRLTLNGKNPVVDRRTMNFSGNITKKPKAATGGGVAMQHVNRNGDVENDTGSGAGGQGNGASSAAAGAPAGAQDSDGESGASDSNSSADAEQIKKKPGGCGCRVAGTRSGDPWLLFAPLGLLLALGLRRRRAG